MNHESSSVQGTNSNGIIQSFFTGYLLYPTQPASGGVGRSDVRDGVINAGSFGMELHRACVSLVMVVHPCAARSCGLSWVWSQNSWKRCLGWKVDSFDFFVLMQPAWVTSFPRCLRRSGGARCWRRGRGGSGGRSGGGGGRGRFRLKRLYACTGQRARFEVEVAHANYNCCDFYSVVCSRTEE